MRRMAIDVFAAPVPGGKRSGAAKCHASLTGAARRYTAARLKTQRKCQTDLAAGKSPGVDCRVGDYKGIASRALERLRALVATDRSCPQTAVRSLDLCPSPAGGARVVDATPAIDLLRACATAGVDTASAELFDRVYAPGAPPQNAPAEVRAIASAWVGSGGPTADERNPRFRLVLESPAAVTLDLSSATADAYLLLLTADGAATLAADDNGGGGDDSRIKATLAAGRYLLVAATGSAGETGDFTLQTDAGSLAGCFFAYAAAGQTGTSTLFCEGSTGEAFSDDAYSSLRVPKGLYVRAFADAGGSGRARTYYGDAPSLQPFLDNAISRLEWSRFASDDFFMLLVSDSQITWGYCSDNSGSALCAQEQSFFGGASEEEIAFYYNSNLTGAINAIQASIGAAAFGGVIVNGDLTEFGKQGSDLEDYDALYERGVNANVYPGLGNHDYANNVDDCFTNFCASAMVDYLNQQVRSLNVAAFDYAVVETPLIGTPALRRDTIGSLGYSFDIGDIHFAQLNNYPTYTRLWERLLPNSDNWYDIRSSIPWLRDDLDAAVAGGRKIILNLHDWGSADVAAFRDVLDEYPVTAVFGGHYHGSSGRYAESGPYSDGKLVPAFLSGSAHYGTMLVDRFTNGKLYVWVLRVDQFNGGTLQVRQGGVFANVGDLSTLFDVCPVCAPTYEYVYDLR
jgi:cytolysin (calcineurin-like family phosphatase)